MSEPGHPSGRQPAMSWAAFVRFVVVGSLCFALALTGVYLLTEFAHWHYLLSTLTSIVCANVLGWLINRSWTYELDTRRSSREFLRYALVNVLGMAFSMGLLAGLVSGLGMHYLLACVVVAITMAVINFNAHGRWSLQQRGDGSA